MDKYILDTNLYFNMESGLGLGKKTEEVVIAMTNGMKKMKSDKKAEFYAPPRIVDEFLSFFEDKNQLFIKEFLSVLTVKSPDMHVINFPASVAWQLIDDVRNRNYRGQTIAEEEIIQSAKQDMVKLDKKEFEINIGPIIKRFRTKYRQATRFGFLDSVADLELILLSKELNGFLISADEGVMKWARIFGVKEMSPQVFGKMLSEA